MTKRSIELRFDDASASPALSDLAWRALSPSTPAEHGQELAILRAYADALASPMQVLSAWRDGALVAVVTGLGLDDARSRGSVFLVSAPGVLCGRCRGLWTAPGADDAIDPMLDALPRELARRGYARVVVRNCVAGDPIVGRAEALGYRALAFENDHRLELAPDATFASYADALSPRTREGLRRHLRSASKVSATLEAVSPLPDALWDELWAMQLDTFARKRAQLRWRDEGLFASLRRHLPPSSSGAVVCRHEGRLLGFTLYHRAGDLLRWPYVGHVADPPLHVYSALLAEMMRAEILHGARRFLLGGTAGTSKLRVGARAIPQVSLYRVLV